MEVVDAKQAYLKWNEKNFEFFVSQFNEEKQSALKLIPLFLQTNDRLLPGYNGPDTPAGIYGYLPGTRLVDEAKAIHNKFKLAQKRPLKNTIIESVYLQQDILSEELTLWVIHIDKLKTDQIEELENKINRILIWLRTRNIFITAHLITSKRLARKSKSNPLFLDGFYHGSFLLAGKYPVWWLVPSEKENEYDAFVDHIKTARFVKAEEFLDIGGLAVLSPDMTLKSVINYAQNAYKTPEISYLKILILRQVQSKWPDIDGLAYRIKNYMYTGSENYQDYFSYKILLDILRSSIAEMQEKQQPGQKLSMSYSKLFGLLSRYTDLISKSILRDLSNDFDVSPRGIGVTEYVNFNKFLFSEIQKAYIKFLEQYEQQKGNNSPDKKLITHSQQVLSFLSQNVGRIPVYITKNRPEFILDRILIKHNVESGKLDSWSLVIQLGEWEEKTISVFDSLISLIAWSWLNRIIDRSTQISIQCPRLLIKQTEALYVLESLIHNINPDDINHVSKRALERANTPLRSLLFFNQLIDDFKRQEIEASALEDNSENIDVPKDNSYTSCEQIIVNGWGDVHTKAYFGIEGVLQCLIDWTKHIPFTRRSNVKDLRCLAYGSDESAFLAQRTDQIYDELIDCFYTKKQLNGCLILFLENTYFSVFVRQDHLQLIKIGNVKSLYQYFENENEIYKPYILERLVLPETPLKEVFQRNKKDVIQIFFQSISGIYEAWILDEKGSLCRIQHKAFNRSSYIAHWLYVMRNIRNHFKKMNINDGVLPEIEIYEVTGNRLSGIDFNSVGSEDLNKNWRFIGVQIEVAGYGDNEKISLICENRNFDYDEFGEKAVSECVKYISSELKANGAVPVYVTNVNAPIQLYGVEAAKDIQTIHFMKYIRGVDKMLNKLLLG